MIGYRWAACNTIVAKALLQRLHTCRNISGYNCIGERDMYNGDCIADRVSWYSEKLLLCDKVMGRPELNMKLLRSFDRSFFWFSSKNHMRGLPFFTSLRSMINSHLHNPNGDNVRAIVENTITATRNKKCFQTWNLQVFNAMRLFEIFLWMVI